MLAVLGTTGTQDDEREMVRSWAGALLIADTIDDIRKIRLMLQQALKK